MIREDVMICPICEGALRYYDSVRRIVRTKYGKTDFVLIRRMRCCECNSFHREINEFYDFLGIDRVEYGDYLGFNADQMWIDGFTAPWIDIHTQRAINCDGKEFYILQFDWDPIPNYTEVTE